MCFLSSVLQTSYTEKAVSRCLADCGPKLQTRLHKLIKGTRRVSFPSRQSCASAEAGYRGVMALSPSCTSGSYSLDSIFILGIVQYE